SEILEKKIQVNNEKNSSLLRVSFTYTDKELAYKVLNSLISNYLKFSAQLNKDEKSYTKEILEKKIPQLEDEIKQISDKIQKFKEEKSLAPTIEAEELSKGLIKLYQTLSDMEAKVSSYEKTVKLIESQIKQTKGIISESLYTPDSKVISELRAQLINLNVELSGLLQTYNESAPEVKEVKEKIRKTEEALEKEIRNKLSSKIDSSDPVLSELYSNLAQAQLQYEVSKVQYEVIKKQIENVEANLKKFPSYEQEYITLQRDYTIKQQLYSQLVLQYEQSKLSEAGLTAKIPIVVEEPTIPEKPSKPNKKLTLAIGGVLGIFLGILGIFLREATDKIIRDEEDIKRLFGIQPVIFTQNEITTLSKSNNLDSKSLKELSVKLFEENEPKVIGFTNVSDLEMRLSTKFADYISKTMSTVLITKDKKENISPYPLSEGLSIISEPALKEVLVGKIEEEFSRNLNNLKEKYELAVVELPNYNDPNIYAGAKYVDKVVVVTIKDNTKKYELMDLLMNLGKTGKDLMIVFVK
ncbi:MAG TPA: GumC family protein, partial [Fervidobacterium nodosum]|nr:GumC family protein [Fervidobacterium nodosum]